MNTEYLKGYIDGYRDGEQGENINKFWDAVKELTHSQKDNPKDYINKPFPNEYVKDD